VPFIQDVNLIDKRVLEWDGNPSDMPTKDKLYISVDLFARWRIVDPLQYFLRLHDERSAQSRLDDVLGSETRNTVAKHLRPEFLVGMAEVPFIDYRRLVADVLQCLRSAAL
jgi:modulator of FtsH protease HflC